MRTRQVRLMVAAAALLLVAACSKTNDTATTGSPGTTAASSGTTTGTAATGSTGSTPGTTPKKAPTKTDAATIQAMVKDAKLVAGGKLTICSDIPYAPFEFEDGGKLTGFDVNLTDAMAKDMGLTTDWKTTPFDSIIPALASGSCDVIVSATTITAERSAKVLFSDPYFDADQSLLVVAADKGTYKSLDDLAGKTIGVQSGTTGSDYAKAHTPTGATIKEFPGADDLFAAITSSDIQAVLQDFPVNQYRAFKNPSQFAVTETFPTGEQYGMATTKENTKLNGALNAALGNAQASGEYDTIYTTWFGPK